MVVGDDDTGGIVDESGGEDLSRVDEGSGEGADGDGLLVNELVAGVEVEGDEVLLLLIAQTGELIERILRRTENGESVVE